MGKYFKFQGITQLHKFRYQVQTHIIPLLSILVTGEAEMEDDPVISGDLRAVQGETLRYPLTAVVVLMPQQAILDVIYPVQFVQIGINIVHVPHIDLN